MNSRNRRRVPAAGGATGQRAEPEEQRRHIGEPSIKWIGRCNDMNYLSSSPTFVFCCCCASALARRPSSITERQHQSAAAAPRFPRLHRSSLTCARNKAKRETELLINIECKPIAQPKPGSRLRGLH